MGSTTGERQIGKHQGDIAPNHVARYEWAAGALEGFLKPNAHILDAASGVAYGSKILAEKTGAWVTAVDVSAESEKYRSYFSHPKVTFLQKDLLTLDGSFAAAVSIETIEHVDGDKWLALLSSMTNILVGTVPNQDVVPFDRKLHPFHLRHYTKAELTRLLSKHGFEVLEWATQYAKWERYEMVPGSDGMTLGFVAVKKVL